MHMLTRLALFFVLLSTFNNWSMSKLKNKFNKYSFNKLIKSKFNKYAPEAAPKTVRFRPNFKNKPGLSARTYLTTPKIGLAGENNKFARDAANRVTRTGFFDVFSKNQALSYSTNQQSTPIKIKKSRGPQNEYKDPYFEKDLNEILKNAYSEKSFIDKYRGLSNVYDNGYIKAEHEEYYERRYRELKKIVENNPDYKELADDYDKTRDLLNSDGKDGVMVLTNEIKSNCENILTSNPEQYNQIPLLALDIKRSIFEYSDKDELIASRLIHLKNSVNESSEKKVTVENIKTNAYFEKAFRIIENQFNNPELKSQFNQQCASFALPETIDDYLKFLRKPFFGNPTLTLIEQIFGDALINLYLLCPKNEYATAKAFIQFLTILKKMINDPEFRESAMQVLKIDEYDKKAREQNLKKNKDSKKGFFSFFN